LPAVRLFRGQLLPLSQSGFRLLFLSTLGSSLGTLLAAVALTIDVKDRTGSGIWVGALLVVEFLPTILIGLTLGPLLDRLSRRGLMIGADLTRAAVFAALPFVSRPGAIVALAAVAGVATGFFRPAVYAGIPNLVPDAQLLQANALVQGVETVSWAVGPVLGGLLTAASGPHAAYWLNAVSFVVSAALVARIPARLLQSATALTRGHWRDIADGFGAVRRSRALVSVLVAWSTANLGLAAINVGAVFLAKDTFHAGDFGYGLLYGATGAGLLVGSLAAGAVSDRFGVAGGYSGAIALLALGVALAAVAPGVWVAAAFCVVIGAGNGVAGIFNALLVQRGAPDELRGRALTLVMSANYVVLGLGMAAWGLALDAVGPRWVWGGGAVVLAAAAAAAWLLTRGVVLAPSADGPAEEPPGPPRFPELDAVAAEGARARD
jgi:MFS family permease